MPMSFQVVFDARDPHTLADWWAETLGWSVEPSDEAMIRDLVAKGMAAEEDTLTHNGVLVWRIGAAIVHPDGTGPGSRILFQVVPEDKTVKNRVHLDLRDLGDDQEAVVAALTERGATRLYDETQGPFSWTTMADPEGNEFCVPRYA